jgi:hypothetical protein
VALATEMLNRKTYYRSDAAKQRNQSQQSCLFAAPDKVDDFPDAFDAVLEYGSLFRVM